jgi:hypothetical protein
MNFKCFCILYFRLLGVKKRGDNKIIPVLTAKKRKKISRQRKKEEEKFRSIFDAKKKEKNFKD